ncbi:hypothetical protein DB346_24245 [Verrucomicrobia bacterium LW23]|nr:hypothetical protein DB346_24245 [Verrucomicrobia bacterium LW23]
MKRWLSWLLFGSIGTVALLTLAAVVAFYSLRSYLRGDEFRLLASRAVSSALNVEGEFQPFQWEGTSVYTEGFDARGRADAVLGRLRGEQLRADFNIRSLFIPPYRLNHLNLDKLRIDFVTPQPGAQPGQAPPPVATPPTPLPPPAPVETPEAEREGEKKANKFRIDQISVREGHLSWPGPGSAERLHLEACPEDDNDGWIIDITGGTLKQEGVGVPMNLESGRLRFKEQTLYVGNGKLRPTTGPGQLIVNGNVAFRERTRLNLQVDVSQMEIERFLPTDWRAKLSGRVTGLANVTGHTDTKGDLLVAGDAHMEAGLLQALPELEQLAKYTKVDDFRKIKFDQASAKYRWTELRLELTDIRIFSKELLGIEGNITKQGDHIEGVIQLGITPDALSLVPGVFTEPRDGLLWTTVRLSGTPDNLTEDLTPRLTAAALRNLPNTAADEAQKLLDKANNKVQELIPGVKLPDLPKIKF